MSTDTPSPQESTGTVTGPHDGRDSDGQLDHRYWRCQRCGLETTDPRLLEGCFRCGRDVKDEGATDEEDPNRERSDGEPTDGGESGGKERDGRATDGGVPDG